MSFEQAVQSFWNNSQRLHACQDPHQKDFLKTMVIQPIIASTDSHVEKELLSRLLAA